MSVGRWNSKVREHYDKVHAARGFIVHNFYMMCCHLSECGARTTKGGHFHCAYCPGVTFDQTTKLLQHFKMHNIRQGDYVDVRELRLVMEKEKLNEEDRVRRARELDAQEEAERVEAKKRAKEMSTGLEAFKVSGPVHAVRSMGQGPSTWLHCLIEMGRDGAHRMICGDSICRAAERDRLCRHVFQAMYHSQPPVSSLSREQFDVRFAQRPPFSPAIRLAVAHAAAQAHGNAHELCVHVKDTRSWSYFSVFDVLELAHAPFGRVITSVRSRNGELECKCSCSASHASCFHIIIATMAFGEATPVLDMPEGDEEGEEADQMADSADSSTSFALYAGYEAGTIRYLRKTVKYQCRTSCKDASEALDAFMASLSAMGPDARLAPREVACPGCGGHLSREDRMARSIIIRLTSFKLGVPVFISRCVNCKVIYRFVVAPPLSPILSLSFSVGSFACTVLAESIQRIVRKNEGKKGGKMGMDKSHLTDATSCFPRWTSCNFMFIAFFPLFFHISGSTVPTTGSTTSTTSSSSATKFSSAWRMLSPSA